MEHKYIDAELLKAKINKMFCHYPFTLRDVNNMIDELPAADVEPVRKWIPCSEMLPEDGEKVLVY